MTTEYAIDLFNSEIKNLKRIEYHPQEAVQEYIDAFEMAIDAIKRTEKTPTMITFSMRKQLEEKYQRWLLDNPGVKDCPFNVISCLCGLFDKEKIMKVLEEQEESK